MDKQSIIDDAQAAIDRIADDRVAYALAFDTHNQLWIRLDAEFTASDLYALADVLRHARREIEHSPEKIAAWLAQHQPESPTHDPD